jgi:4-hydroxy-3-polyprenylbenzoate decarboxylase
VKGINARLAMDWNLPILFIAVEKNKPGHIATLHEALCQLPEIQNIKLILYVEHTVIVDDIADVLWRGCNNLDPKRDHSYGGKNKNILALDGTRKTKKLDGFERDWPNIIVADDATIAAVDQKWVQLGLGEIIISPSIKYKTQLYGGGASVLDVE